MDLIRLRHHPIQITPEILRPIENQLGNAAHKPIPTKQLHRHPKTLMYITKSESKKNCQTRSEDAQPCPIDRKAEIPPTPPKQGRAPFPPKEQFPPAQFPRAASNWPDKPSLQIPPKGLYCHYRKGELSKRGKRTLRLNLHTYS